jgi:hypothetical protein
VPDQQPGPAERITEQLSALVETLRAYGERLVRLEKWLVRDYTSTGKPIPGVLDYIATIASFKSWFISLGSAIALGLAVNAVIAYVHLHYLGAALK